MRLDLDTKVANLAGLSVLALGILNHLSQAQSVICNLRSSSPPPANGLPFCSLPAPELASGRILPGSSVRETPFPPWMNTTLVRQGQAFAAKNRFSTLFTAFAGLVLGLPVPDAFNVLAFTSASDNNDKALRRYAATAAQFLVWLESPFSVDPAHDAVSTSIHHTREYHIAAAKRANATSKPIVDPHKYDSVLTDDAMWTAIEADFAASSLPHRTWPSHYSQYDADAVPINQFIQGLTLTGFMGFTIINPQKVHIWDATEQELTAYLHVWAVIGWAIGIDDDYNVCLQPDPPTAAAYFKDIIDQYVFPGFYSVGKIVRVLTESLLRNQIPGIEMRPVMYSYISNLIGIPAPHLNSTLTPADVFILQQYNHVFVPTAKLEPVRALSNVGLETAIDAAVLAYFGPYFTKKQWAEHVFFPSMEPQHDHGRRVEAVKFKSFWDFFWDKSLEMILTATEFLLNLFE